MARRRPAEDEAEEQPQTFTMPLLGAVYSSLVVVAVVAALDSRLGRSLEHRIDAPARTLIAAPVIVTAVVVFLASMAALLVPRYRRQSLKVAEIGAWLIPAWLLIGALVLGAVSFALHQAS